MKIIGPKRTFLQEMLELLIGKQRKKIQGEEGELIHVYAIYMDSNDVVCLGLPRNTGGLCSYKMKEVTVINSTFSGKLIYCHHNSGTGIFHWALIEENLLDDLLKQDETAYQRFLQIVKAEGSIDADFY